ncbi:5-aminolevulic acid synthase [Rhodovulum euryhalinum]|nr:5-aminolevulic acid synthase [Rhodovulum euryhalinum]
MGAALAEPLDGRTARAQLFDPSGVEITLMRHDFLSEKDLTALEFAARQQQYYGAIAAAPSEGLVSEATVAAANYHDVASAGASAVKACDSARKGGKPCVVVAEIRPIGWEPRRISLSAAASDGVRKQYRPAKGRKAMAISSGTGIWAVASGPEAERDAVASCARQSKRDDCRVVIADR